MQYTHVDKNLCFYLGEEEGFQIKVKVSTLLRLAGD